MAVQHRPKVLIIGGWASASGRSFSLALLDSLSSALDSRHILKDVSVHLILDGDPSAQADANECSAPAQVAADAEEALSQFAFKEKFTFILSTDFRSVGLSGGSSWSSVGVRKLQERQLTDAYIRQLSTASRSDSQRYFGANLMYSQIIFHLISCFFSIISGGSNCHRTDNSISSAIAHLSGSLNGTVALRLGLSCCADSERTEAILSAHRTALLDLVLAARQGVAGFVTDPSGQPLAAVVTVTPSGSRRMNDTYETFAPSF